LDVARALSLDDFWPETTGAARSLRRGSFSVVASAESADDVLTEKAQSIAVASAPKRITANEIE
jgi:hypothetical protein